MISHWMMAIGMLSAFWGWGIGLFFTESWRTTWRDDVAIGMVVVGANVAVIGAAAWLVGW
jgi:hypothetical protein